MCRAPSRFAKRCPTRSRFSLCRLRAKIWSAAFARAARIPTEEIARRLKRAHDEMKRCSDYDFIVVNDDLERAGREVHAIGLASRCRNGIANERLSNKF